MDHRHPIIDSVVVSDYVKPTYNEIHDAVIAMCTRIINNQHIFQVPRRVVGLARGGLIPAVIASHFFSVPMTIAHYSSKSGKGDNRDHENAIPFIYDVEHGGPLLLVDDICDSGLTIKEVTYDYRDILGYNVTTMSLYHKQNAAFTPDLFWVELAHDAPFIDFPWERTNG
jgi:hypoxanthine phosphoribosyltransferase